MTGWEWGRLVNSRLEVQMILESQRQTQDLNALFIGDTECTWVNNGGDNILRSISSSTMIDAECTGSTMEMWKVRGSTM